MTNFEPNKLISHLQAKWGSRPCPMCQVQKWEVEKSIFQLTEFNQGSLVLGGPVVPVVPVTCKNCGFTVLVNALVSGVLTPPPQPPEEQK